MPRSPSELRLGRMRRLLRQPGRPAGALRIVHVAGTKGKGSTAAMIAAGALGLGGPDRPVLLAPPAPAGGAVPRRRPDGHARGAGRADRGRPPGRRRARRPRPAPRPSRPDLLRDHHRDGPAPLRPAGGRRGRPGGRAGRPARLDQRRPPAAVGPHVDLVRPHAAARHRRWPAIAAREGRHPQARPPCRSAASAAPRPAAPSATSPRGGGPPCASWTGISGSDTSHPQGPSTARPPAR